jgi:hypothetical protein
MNGEETDGQEPEHARSRFRAFAEASLGPAPQDPI